ncbi:MAG: iron ABC transporter permease [Lachnospiraceae bacterium]|nr:iron ABC transporter permease [Lachnospiraceae bacterium]
MNRKRYMIGFGLLVILIAVLAWVNLVLGSVDISVSDVIAILCGKHEDAMQTSIITRIRLPRMTGAILFGGALALSGYLLQTFFGNPIVGPFVLGISSGAKLTVALTMIFCLSKGREIGAGAMVLSAFTGAICAMILVLIFSVRVKSRSSLVVCGIMIGYICSAITDFVVTFADDSNIVNLHNWSKGSLSGINFDEIRIVVLIVAVCLVVSIFMIKPIGAFRLGEAYARSAGVNIRLLRVMLILVSSMLAACVTAFAGPISFIGIAIPHLVRTFMKTDTPGVMIPACFLGGAAVTLLCDAIARYVFAPTELSISSVTAVLLVPVVIFMMGKRSAMRRDT